MGREARARANRQRDLTETAAGCLQLLDEMAKDAFARFGSSGTLAATFLVVPSAGKAFHGRAGLGGQRNEGEDAGRAAGNVP